MQFLEPYLSIISNGAGEETTIVEGGNQMKRILAVGLVVTLAISLAWGQGVASQTAPMEKQ